MAYINLSISLWNQNKIATRIGAAIVFWFIYSMLNI